MAEIQSDSGKKKKIFLRFSFKMATRIFTSMNSSLPFPSRGSGITQVTHIHSTRNPVYLHNIIFLYPYSPQIDRDHLRVANMAGWR